MLLRWKWEASLIEPFSSPGNADRLNAWSDFYLRFRVMRANMLTTVRIHPHSAVSIPMLD